MTYLVCGGECRNRKTKIQIPVLHSPAGPPWETRSASESQISLCLPEKQEHFSSCEPESRLALLAVGSRGSRGSRGSHARVSVTVSHVTQMEALDLPVLLGWKHYLSCLQQVPRRVKALRFIEDSCSGEFTGDLCVLPILKFRTSVVIPTLNGHYNS